jgi:hypothetical protein
MSRLLGLRRGREMVKTRLPRRVGASNRACGSPAHGSPTSSPAGIGRCGFDRSGEAIDAEAGRPLVVEAGDPVPARDATQRATHAADTPEAASSSVAVTVWPVQRHTTGMDRLLSCSGPPRSEPSPARRRASAASAWMRSSALTSTRRLLRTNCTSAGHPQTECRFPMDAAAAPPAAFRLQRLSSYAPVRTLRGVELHSWLGREQPELSESREVVFHDRER